MYYNKFQTGGSLELYNPTNKELLENWNFTGKCKKIYDKSIKSYMHLLDNGGISKMSIPKDNISLGIVQGYIVFQIYLLTQKNFSIEISVSDTQNTRHRLIFSSNLRELNMNYFTCVIPMAEIPIGNWVNLSIDVLSFVTYCFKDLTFKSIDNIVFSANGKIRRIFTMRSKINDDNELNDNNNIKNIEYEKIPSQFIIKGDNIDVININMNDEVCINNPILKDKFYNKKPKFHNKEYLLSNITNISRIYDKEKNMNLHSRSLDKYNNINSNFKLSDKYDNNNDNNKNLNILVTKVENPKNKDFNDNYYKNDRYTLKNKGIINTINPIVISNSIQPSVISSSMKSKVNIKSNNKNINIEEKLDDKGQVYFDSNSNNINFNEQILKESYKQDIAQVTQSMKNINTNLNYNKAGQYINNKKKNNK